MLNPEDIAAIKERAEKATAGPWLIEPSQGEGDKRGRFHRDDYNNRVMIVTPDCDIHAIIDCSANHTCIETMEQEDNADFIAHARQDIPALLAHVEELEAKLSNDRKLLRMIADIQVSSFAPDGIGTASKVRELLRPLCEHVSSYLAANP